MDRIDIQLTKDVLQVQDCLDFVQASNCGGIDVFIGNVRDQTDGKSVTRLEFEGYEPMAISEMQKIARQILERWPTHAISMHHRLGTLEIGDTAVIIAVSSAHRDAAFSACRYAIDTLKETVPIWKKEIFDDGEVWVAAHP